jgi:signal peptidase II
MQAAGGTPIAGAGRSGAAARWLFVGVAGLGWLVDVVTKVAAVHWLDPSRPVRVVDPLLTLRLIRNPGAAFSLGEGVTPAFALLATGVLGYVVVRLVPRLGHRGWSVALGLLSAGVAGNLTDRVLREPGFLRGHVVDFLQIPHWPVFNLADMCICGAAVLIVVLTLGKKVAIDGQRYPEAAGPKADRTDEKAPR